MTKNKSLSVHEEQRKQQQKNEDEQMLNKGNFSKEL